MRILQRQVEASVGGPLLRMASRKGLQESKLEQKSAYLPASEITMHYLEKGPLNDASLTLLFCHGLSDKAINMAPFITSLKIPENVRVVVPDIIGHGQDLERVRQNQDTFQQPSPQQQLHAMIELLEVLKIKNCNAFGYSLGGALVYFLRQARPDLVNRTVLLSPAIEACLDPTFVQNYKNGKNRFIRISSRNDVKQLFRDMSTPSPQKKNPIPAFFYEAIYRQSQRDIPEGHWESMLDVLLNDTNETMSCCKDIDKESPRLVLWPEQDFICNCELGQEFFRESTATEFCSIPDCGHVFFSNGTFLLTHVAPQVSCYLLQGNNDGEKEKAMERHC